MKFKKCSSIVYGNIQESQNPKFRYEISDNLLKVSKMKKNIIDFVQIITDMTDELVSLEMTYGERINDINMEIVKDMKKNLTSMDMLLRKKDKNDESNISVQEYTDNLQQNLEKLKSVYLKRKINTE